LITYYTAKNKKIKKKFKHAEKTQGKIKPQAGFQTLMNSEGKMNKQK